jgi:hypothetical protein
MDGHEMSHIAERAFEHAELCLALRATAEMAFTSTPHVSYKMTLIEI